MNEKLRIIDNLNLYETHDNVVIACKLSMRLRMSFI